MLDLDVEKEAIVWLTEPWNCSDVVWVRVKDNTWFQVKIDDDHTPMVVARTVFLSDQALLQFILRHYCGYNVRQCYLADCDALFPGRQVPEREEDGK